MDGSQGAGALEYGRPIESNLGSTAPGYIPRYQVQTFADHNLYTDGELPVGPTILVSVPSEQVWVAVKLWLRHDHSGDVNVHLKYIPAGQTSADKWIFWEQVLPTAVPNSQITVQLDRPLDGGSKLELSVDVGGVLNAQLTGLILANQ